MEQLKFTTRVLGPLTAYRLGNRSVSQTLRAYSNDIVQAILLGKLKVDDQMEVTLDNRMIGFARYIKMDAVRWRDIDLSDARQGGFDTVDDLEKALQRAGFRFKPMDNYRLHRLQFSWLEEA